MFRARRAVVFTNGHVLAAGGLAGSIRVDSNVLELDGPARGNDRVVDLQGAFVLPGLINAHDHLELNHYGALKVRERYVHVDDWIDDLRPRLRNDPEIRRNVSFPLADRLFVGALKNLLAGVTTVAHHNPRYPQLARRFPIRVLDRYGWAHSFAMEHQPVGARGETGGIVVDRCAATPPSWPFIVHVGEGVDERAASELVRFRDSACLRPNSVIVHGVAHGLESWRAAVSACTSLVWCPASNAFLFGRTLPLHHLLDALPASQAQVCLGSDSRLTGARDLLDELRFAAAALPLRAGGLLPMVTTSAARVLRLPEAGHLAPGVPADLTIVPPDPDCPDDAARALLAARRGDVRLVMIGGRPLVGDPAFGAAFEARGEPTGRLCVDGAHRLAASSIVRALEACAIAEPGVEVLA